MDQGDQRIAPDDELKGKKTRGTKLAKKPVRSAHMNEPSLHPALEPSCPLAQPAADICRGLFVRGGCDHAGSIAEAGEPHAEVGVLRDIVRIPSSDFA